LADRKRKSFKRKREILIRRCCSAAYSFYIRNTVKQNTTAYALGQESLSAFATPFAEYDAPSLRQSKLITTKRLHMRLMTRRAFLHPHKVITKAFLKRLSFKKQNNLKTNVYNLPLKHTPALACHLLSEDHIRF
jgi:hypothetical protein